VVAGVVAGVVPGAVGDVLVVGEVVGDVLVVGEVVGFLVVGDGDGVLVGDGVGVGVTLGWTAAPCVVSSSNLVTPSIASKVYAAQIRAG
jgi:hypothetical protein